MKREAVVVDTRGKQERYRLLESTRDYALTKLKASGEHERLARRHADYFRGIAQKAEPSFGAVPLSEWLAKLEPGVENIRAAMDWALVRDQDAALGGSVAGTLEMFWWHGGEAEGLHWINMALQNIDEGRQSEGATPAGTFTYHVARALLVTLAKEDSRGL